MAKIAIDTGVSLMTDAERMQYEQGYDWGAKARYVLNAAQQRDIARRDDRDPFARGVKDALDGKGRAS